MKFRVLGFVFLGACSLAFAQEKKPTEKPKMQFMGAYDAGQPGVNMLDNLV